jgi:hypothetical protein
MKTKNPPARIAISLPGRMARMEFIRKALADDVTFALLKQRPTPKFIAGISLVGISYIIGWPAVAFFTFLAVYLEMKSLALLGPVSYIFSHLVFLAGVALAGGDGIRYGDLCVRWSLHKFALWLTKKTDQNRGDSAHD